MNNLIKRIIIVILFGFPFYAVAQHFNGGVLAGITASQVDGDSYAGFDKVGLQGGVFVNRHLTQNWQVQLEIKYTSRGARKKTDETDPEIYKLTLHYIDLPIILGFSATDKIILEAGLAAGYRFGVSGEDSGGKLPDEYLVAFKKTDFNWLLGLRYKFNNAFSFGMRYSYSIVSICEYDYNVSNYGWMAKLFGYRKGDFNNYFTFGIYYQL